MVDKVIDWFCCSKTGAALMGLGWVLLTLCLFALMVIFVMSGS